MSAFSFIVGVILPYITIPVFLGSMIWRVKKWSKLPQPAMTLFPAPSSNPARFVSILRESFLFEKILKTDKTFWWGTWLFHVSLAFIFIGHFRVLTDFPGLWTFLGLSKSGVDTLSATLGGIAGVVILMAAIYLIWRRIFVEEVRQISSPVDYFAILLIIVILSTGNFMRFFQHFDLGLTRTYFHQLITFSYPQPPQNSVFIWHLFLAQVLIIYLPFSKILHFGGIFFSQNLLKRS